MKLRICIACLVLATSGAAQPPRDGVSRPDQGRTFRTPGRPYGFFRDNNSTSPMSAYRQAIQQEVARVPALQPKLQELMDLQKQRFEIHRERYRIASQPENPDAALRKFHDLLKQEDALNERQRKLQDQFLKDYDKIREQVARRRQQIEQELAKTPADSESHDNLSRTVRFYTSFEKRLETVKENPDRPDVLNRLLRSGPQPDQEPDEAHQRVQEIRQELRELQRRQERLREELQRLQKDHPMDEDDEMEGPPPGTHRPSPPGEGPPPHGRPGQPDGPPPPGAGGHHGPPSNGTRPPVPPTQGNRVAPPGRS